MAENIKKNKNLFPTYRP